MEREIMLSGLGGQGVQLAAKTLAAAAVHEGLEVMVFGTYGGSMRGGNTDSTMVIGTGPIRTPPVIDATWSALMMHHENWPMISARLRRSEEHTSELQSLMRISYAVFCLRKKKTFHPAIHTDLTSMAKHIELLHSSSE